MMSPTLATSTLRGSMRRYSSCARPARYWHSSSMSSGLPSATRTMDTAASRTSGCRALSVCERRAMVRRASSAEMTPSSDSHSTSCCQCTGPRGTVRAEAALGLGCALMAPWYSASGPEDTQPFARRQAPAALDGLRPLGKLGPRGVHVLAQRQHHGVALTRRFEGPDRFGTESGLDPLQAAVVAGRA